MILRFLRGLRSEEVGATAIEYGLIAGLVSVVIIGALRLVNSQMIGVYDYISSNLAQALLQ
jgi:pilus assembly protein Flp/PilA